jgi:hypothetical protein
VSTLTPGHTGFGGTAALALGMGLAEAFDGKESVERIKQEVLIESVGVLDREEHVLSKREQRVRSAAWRSSCIRDYHQG